MLSYLLNPVADRGREAETPAFSAIGFVKWLSLDSEEVVGVVNKLLLSFLVLG